MQIRTIEDVVSLQQCTGCGVCAYAEPDRYEMIDVPEYGRRPIVKDGGSNDSGYAFQMCPGKGLTYDIEPTSGQENHPCWGPVRAVYEGHATDHQIRWRSSSGGIATSIAAHCVEELGMIGVLHTAMDAEKPYLNKTVYSTRRDQIIAASGSRYSPASPCDGLKKIETGNGKSVFIGKPCDVAAVKMAAGLNPQLSATIGLTVAFFCAGVPSTKGLKLLLENCGVKNLNGLTSLKFRGNGWPGHWEAEWVEDGQKKTKSLTYEDSWGFLESHRQWRCRVCADHTGEFADIAVGDPWYREIGDEEPGSSLIIARTQLGSEILSSAIEDKVIKVQKKNTRTIDESQSNLIKSRGLLWGRLFTLWIMDAPRPRYSGFVMFSYWLRDLSFQEKLQSIFGTVRRVIRRKLRKRVS